MNLGVIGYGKRIRKIIGDITQLDSTTRVSAITDIRNDEFRRELQDKEAGIRFFDTSEQMLKETKLDGILIGTRCNLHTEMACKVMSSGIPLFLEKPVAITLEQVNQLKKAYEAADNQKIVVSFPLRLTPIVQYVKEILDSGKISRVEHVQAWNNVTYGGVYFHDFGYRNEEVTGGLFLQKATHDFDYINYLVGFIPVKICAMASKQVMKGDKPAGLRCVDCDEQHTCEESRAKQGPGFRAGYCCFAEDTANEDSGSAIIRYETGMHASYTQNFLVRRKPLAARGARLIGYKGTVEFDFHSKTVQVVMHHTARVESYHIDVQKGHNGGDTALAQNFIDVVKGKAAPLSTMEDGLLSALMCLKAKESAQTDTFRDISSSG